MNFNKTHLLLTFVVLALLGCSGGGGGDTTSGAVNSGGDTTSGTINGINVPPAPDAAANQATVAGVDSNNNSVRDDVERMLATDFGTQPTFYSKAMAFAATEQVAITKPAPTPEDIAAHLDLVRCVSEDQEFDDLDKITRAIIDTPERRNAYAKAFVGANFSIEGCQQ